MESFHDELTDKLVESLVKIKSKEDMYNFLEDLLTIKEFKEMGKRLEAAKLLDSGKNYKEIIEDIGISTATLSRVSKALNYGTGGYKKLINNKK